MPKTDDKGTTVAAPKPAAKPKAARRIAAEREVIYPEPRAEVETLTAKRMKELLGWQEESEGVNFGENYDVKTRAGAKVRLLNNTSNREFDSGLAEAWMTEILKGHWRLNGESMIIGQRGMTISLQHRGVGLIWAVEEYHGKQHEHWAQYWESEPTIESVVVYGIDEDDVTVNTVDTGKPRSGADALYRSQLFSKFKSTDRSKLARITDNCVNQLWHRTGAKNDAFTPRRTHAEMFDFLDQHKRIASAEGACKHIYDSNREGQISRKYLSPGNAAALLYLMAASRSDGDRYYNAIADGKASEKLITFDLWDRAKDFWSLLGGHAQEMAAVRDVKRPFDKDDNGRKVMAHVFAEGSGFGHNERMAYLIRAWKQYAEGNSIEAADLKLHYRETEEGAFVLAEHPLCDGIDQRREKPKKESSEDNGEAEGDAKTDTDIEEAQEESAEVESADEPEEPSAEELEAAKAKEREAKKAALLANRAKKNGESRPKLKGGTNR